MATRCFTPLLGKRMRVTRLDSCGNVPASGTVNAVCVTDGFMIAKLVVEVEAGKEILSKKADGSLCVNFMTNPNFKRVSVEVDFCGVNPALLEMLTTVRALSDYNGVTNGFALTAGAAGVANHRFALEMWTGLAGSVCPTGVQEASGYLLLPFVGGSVIGDIELSGEKEVTFTMKGGYTISGNMWGVGPYNVMMNSANVPSKLPVAADPFDHLILQDTGVAPPPSVCGYLAMPAN